ncbi:hypothetical protein KIN20_002195 [Parelaphostrongylus tenuis]|uniref:Uncharacterized protein n=1 Tax=Parelaphostrongylus tenuis TaxID=148309 RepID=A0AAD5LZF5_PARTN|nr:hypothetical protein KIN20_002195 [Parelaphostrongylus tenuis]
MFDTEANSFLCMRIIVKKCGINLIVSDILWPSAMFRVVAGVSTWVGWVVAMDGVLENGRRFLYTHD